MSYNHFITIQIKKMPIKCIIFDADNTLYFTKNASKLGYAVLFQFLQQKTGISIEKLQSTFNKIVNLAKKDTNPAKRKREYALKNLLSKHFINSPEILAEALEVFWEVVGKNIQPAPEAKKIISALQKNYILALASDEFQKPLILKLKSALGEFNIFKIIVTPEITKTMKPSRIYYDKIIEELKLLPSEILMIGDSWDRDLAPARLVGLKTLLVGPKKKGNPHYWVKKLTKAPMILKLLAKNDSAL